MKKKFKKLKGSQIWADDFFLDNNKIYQCHSFEFSGEIIDKKGKLHKPKNCIKVSIIA